VAWLKVEAKCYLLNLEKIFLADKIDWSYVWVYAFWCFSSWYWVVFSWRLQMSSFVLGIGRVLSQILVETEVWSSFFPSIVSAYWCILNFRLSVEKVSKFYWTILYWFGYYTCNGFLVGQNREFNWVYGLWLNYWWQLRHFCWTGSNWVWIYIS
jgi:hypothetical protein